jgi:phage-related holin
MKEEGVTGFLGFESLEDFTSSLFGLKHWLTNVMVGLIGGMTSFIVDYMWDSPSAVYTLWVLMASDWTTGVLKGMVNKKLSSYKLFRMPLYYVATSFVISIAWWMAKNNILFTPLPGIVMAGFYSVYFVSLLENLGEIGVLPKAMVVMLKTRFGLKKVVDKYFEQNDDNQK